MHARPRRRTAELRPMLLANGALWTAVGTAAALLAEPLLAPLLPAEVLVEHGRYDTTLTRIPGGTAVAIAAAIGWVVAALAAGGAGVVLSTMPGQRDPAVVRYPRREVIGCAAIVAAAVLVALVLVPAWAAAPLAHGTLLGALLLLVGVLALALPALALLLPAIVLTNRAVATRRRG